MGSSEIAHQRKWIWLQGHKFIKLYIWPWMLRIAIPLFTLSRQTYLCLSTADRLGWRWRNRLREQLNGGGILPYQKKVMVSQARGDNTVFQGTQHKAFARHSNVTSWLWSFTELGFLIWSCCEATHSSPRNNDGKAWYATWIHSPTAMCDVR